jgi:polysaccharide pyruvyl transferase WcaK-like protein
MSDILVYGSATHDNRGDLAMMHGLIAHLRRQRPRSRISLITRNPQRSEEEFGIQCVMSPDGDISSSDFQAPRRLTVIGKSMAFISKFLVWRYISPRLAERITSPNTVAFFRALSSSRVLIIHGSGSFNSIFWHGWLYPKAVCAICARSIRLPVVMTSQGIGPFYWHLDRLMARLFFQSAAYIGVRDGAFSEREAIACGAPPDRIYHAGDDSMLLPPLAEEAIERALRAQHVPVNRLLIGVNFRDAASYDASHHDSGHAVLAYALDDVVRKYEAHVVFVPITYDPADDDRESVKRVVASMAEARHSTIIEDEYPADMIRGLIGRMDIAVAASYHFLLFAMSSGVPAVALTRNDYYLSKHRGLLSLYKQDMYRIDMNGAKAQQIACWIERAIEHRAQIKEQLIGRQRELDEMMRKAHNVLDGWV